MTNKTKNTCLWAINLAINRFNEHIELIELKKELEYTNPKDAEFLISNYQSWIKEMNEAYKEIEGIDL